METVKLTSRAGSDGVLHLEVPVGIPDADVEILVVFHVVAANQTETHPVQEADGWPPGFLDQVYGGWQGEPLERADQGDYEVRESFD